MILVNKPRAEENGVEAGLVLKHEQQHAENSLYLRPKNQRNEGNKIMSESADVLVEIIKRGEIETMEVMQALAEVRREKKVVGQAERQEIFNEHLDAEAIERLRVLFTEALERTQEKMEQIVAHFQETSIETMVKEELLAFYFSGTQNEDLREVIPNYILEEKTRMTKLRSLFEEFVLNYYPDDLLEELGIPNPQGKRNSLSMRQGLLAALSGSIAMEKDTSAMAQAFAGAEESLDK